MDLYCPRCAEPWDNDELHEVAAENGSTYSAMAKRFRSEGCVVFTHQVCERTDSLRSSAAAAMYDLLGDDMDGAAAMMDDFGF